MARGPRGRRAPDTLNKEILLCADKLIELSASSICFGGRGDGQVIAPRAEARPRGDDQFFNQLASTVR